MTTAVDGGLFVPVLLVLYIMPVPIFTPQFLQCLGFCTFQGAGAVRERLVQGCEGSEPWPMAGVAREGAMSHQKAGSLPREGKCCFWGSQREMQMFPNLLGKSAPAAQRC